jgi:hypothetical protein
MFIRFPIGVFFTFLLFNASLAQNDGHARKVREYAELHSRLRELEREILRPTNAEIGTAAEQGLNAIRLMPREKYEHGLTIRGGGAYYSFHRLTHEYNYGSDIELQQGSLSVGFAGADYGLLYDLGERDLSAVERGLPEVRFLVKYEPPSDEPSIRIEQRRSNNYEADGFVYKSRVPALVGHAYILRSINFSNSDILIAFRVVRKDADGSLIIFWKPIESFKKPELARNAAAETQ